MNLNNHVEYANGILGRDLFEGLILPAGLDVQRAKSAIMLECGLLTPIFSEPSTMIDAIAAWSENMQWNFEHLVTLINTEYAPLNNYDRTETKEATGTETLKIEHGEETTNTISAENVTMYQPDRKTEKGGEDNHTTSGDRGYNLRAFGNIGVTTSQQMFLSEIDLIKNFNPYKWIAEAFEKEFCVMVF